MTLGDNTFSKLLSPIWPGVKAWSATIAGRGLDSDQ
jgi:hypothetical protein